jgi:DNA-binding NarL/FixJ family response regulator
MGGTSQQFRAPKGYALHLMEATSLLHPWRVLLVEDDPLMRQFLAASIERSPQLELVGKAGSVAQAKAVLNTPSIQIEVLLTDIGLPDGSGLEVIRHACLHHPECETLVFSMFGDETNVLESIEAGALGYIHKDAAPEDIAKTILEMKAGASPISPMIARRVLSKYVSLKCVEPDDFFIKKTKPISEKTVLTRSEASVLELISRGFTYAEIAQIRSVSMHTIQTHIKNIYSKLAVHSKSEAVFEATRMGLL